jgi:hypothetical protein
MRVNTATRAGGRPNVDDELLLRRGLAKIIVSGIRTRR